jgi:phenylalanyl-tRNA synthetase alpha chain
MHPSEAKLVKLLRKKGKSKASGLAKEMGIKPAAVGRVAYSLSKNGLVELKKLKEEKIVLTKEGEGVKKEGLPERRLLEKLPMPLEEARKHRTAMNWAIKRRWAEVKGGRLVPLAKERPTTPEELALEDPGKLKPGGKKFKLLKKRKWAAVSRKVDYEIELTGEGKGASVSSTKSRLTPEILSTGKWKDHEFRKFSPNSPVPPAYAGRVHPLTEVVEKVRRVFLEMGFQEARGPYVQSAFWCFDALFVPQDHPAREMQDTFYLEGEAELPELAGRVAKVHQKHWGKWDEKEARRKVLRTHTTAVSARMLSEVEPPAKVFLVDRNFRNETVDYKHTAEFYQVEGIVFQEGVTFNHLVGYLKSFFTKLGVPKIRIRPGYFPYTELSAEVDIWFEPKEAWLELGGAGIFRPEVVKPLTGKDIPVLAWGLGLERVAMLNYGIKDIRELYRSDLQTLRERKVML